MAQAAAAAVNHNADLTQCVYSHLLRAEGIEDFVDYLYFSVVIAGAQRAKLRQSGTSVTVLQRGKRGASVLQLCREGSEVLQCYNCAEREAWGLPSLLCAGGDFRGICLEHAALVEVLQFRRVGSVWVACSSQCSLSSAQL